MNIKTLIVKRIDGNVHFLYASEPNLNDFKEIQASELTKEYVLEALAVKDQNDITMLLPCMDVNSEGVLCMREECKECTPNYKEQAQSLVETFLNIVNDFSLLEGTAEAWQMAKEIAVKHCQLNKSCITIIQEINKL